jgi:1,4-dihydroxy-2-naphthoyl-CoA hydrolase
MSIFYKKEFTIEDLNARGRNSHVEWIGIQFIEIGEDYVKASMPVDHRTVQPLGVVNGGAYCSLAESIGSTAANLCIDRSNFVALGLDINANHVRPASRGHVYGVAKPIHLGKSTHVWEIRITDDDDQLVCISRLTVVIVPLPPDDKRRK